jgi:ERCC4-related helicase
MATLNAGSLVKHAQFGQGKVEYDKGVTALVRFGHGIEECDKKTLSIISGPEEALSERRSHPPSEVLLRMQASAIRSVNDAWGVFSPSRIALLPHQLWVCRKVLEKWPARWLIADDVGLGKTIEAGIILWPLISRGIVRRLLILCPASLVEQWQYRLRTMFDIRLSIYLPDADRPKTDFWNTQPMVVASLQTIRDDNKDRHKRLLDAKPWDLVIVDEAHHLNYDEQGGMTLGYSILNKIVDKQKAESILFFTGTPHRGKNFGFLAIMQLLRPDLFDPRKAPRGQYANLPQAMIRNNKECVTDIQGKKIFQKPLVRSETYRYSPAETEFYNMLTEFIATGKAYASKLESADRRTVMLVLISMQKLASSSIAAISKSLKGRADRLAAESERFKRTLDKSANKELQDLQSDIDPLDDGAASTTENIVKLKLLLMENEQARLKELIEAARKVDDETKIEAIIRAISELPASQAVLFFTEYKATQALLMSALIRKFGAGSVTFINGDGVIDGVEVSPGQFKSVSMQREEAAERFNSGTVRFLVSTEAAGEGIDLQENCNYLVHVDLPWNPMRMHQRAGRLNRYGQNKRVEVLILRNPDTVEARIWDILNEKIGNIMAAVGSVMEDPEDLMQLVLGMTSPSLFDELFTESQYVKRDSLKEWFNLKTAQFGGQDAVDLVRNLVGKAQKFDFQQASGQIPKIDLPALKPFFIFSLQWNKRQVRQEENGISFKTPEDWAKLRGVLPQYSGVHFDRLKTGKRDRTVLLGVGHRAVDAALEQALSLSSSVAVLPKKLLESPVIIFKIEDRITGQTGQIQRVIVGVEYRVDQVVFMRDWELLEALNEICDKPSAVLKLPQQSEIDYSDYDDIISTARRTVERDIASLQLPFQLPDVELMGAILPEPDK